MNNAIKLKDYRSLIKNFNNNSEVLLTYPNTTYKLILTFPCMEKLQRIILDEFIKIYNKPSNSLYENPVGYREWLLSNLNTILLRLFCNQSIRYVFSSDEDYLKYIPEINSLLDEFISILSKTINNQFNNAITLDNIINLRFINLYGSIYIEFDTLADSNTNLFTNMQANYLDCDYSDSVD